MQINLFNCTAEKERVDKTDFISNRFAMDGELKQEVSILDPVILVEKTDPIEPGYNYMYIPKFKRWYFINDIISVHNKFWEVHAHVDVLYTWRTDIKENKAIIEKTADTGLANLYMDDGSFVMDSRKYNTVLPFSTGLSTDGSFILICAGGQGGGN